MVLVGLLLYRLHGMLSQHFVSFSVVVVILKYTNCPICHTKCSVVVVILNYINCLICLTKCFNDINNNFQFLIFTKKLDGVAPLVTDPPPTSCNTLSEEKKKRKKEKKLLMTCEL